MSFEQLAAKSFSEKDVENFVKLINLTHTKISGLDGTEALEYFRLAQWAQKTMVPKLKAHILGEPKIHEAESVEKVENA